jgi:hypothetical protein
MSLNAYYALCRQAAALRTEAVIEPQTERRSALHAEADNCLLEASALPCAALCCSGGTSASSGRSGASQGRPGGRGRP